MLAPCLASAITMDAPMPLLPPVTMATFPFRLMMCTPYRSRCPYTSRLLALLFGRGNAAARDVERQSRQYQRNNRRHTVDRVQAQPGIVLQRSDTKRCDAIPHLIERDE